MDMQSEIERWKAGVSDPELAEELSQLLESGDQAAIADAFFQPLSFGTAGLRGIIGPGTNRMNIYTVGKATQGLANYLNEHFEHPSVAIARDSRNKGEAFVQVTASILAANGITVRMFPRIEPVPALSFAVRDLGTSAGVVMTASHNPAAYNGYKVYGPDGCQITSDAAAQISDQIASIDEFADVTTGDFEQFRQQGAISDIEDAVLDRFLQAELSASLPDPEAADVPLKLVYTPLNGTGLELNSRMFEAIGVTDVTVVPEQAKPDGNFPTCPYPNPEIREAMQKGIELCEKVHPDLLLATDPDADRVGIAVENGSDYQLLTGNEVGILMLDYIARLRTQTGTMPPRPVAVSTIVSTAMIDAIAKRYGITVVRTLTGFKYIGNIINDLVAQGREGDFLLGFEESYGYLAATHVRDKDSICASMIICEMAQHYKKRGMNLAQAIEALYAEYGYYRNKTISIAFPGADGSKKMAQIMAGLRSEHPQAIAGFEVRETVDYQPGYQGLPSANVIEFRLGEGVKLIVRPSGTEPKIKAYLFANADSEEGSALIIERLEAAAREMLS